MINRLANGFLIQTYNQKILHKNVMEIEQKMVISNGQREMR